MATVIKPLNHVTAIGDPGGAWVFETLYTVPTGKIAKVRFDLITVQNFSNNTSNSNAWYGQIVVQSGDNEIFLDGLRTPVTTNANAYVFHSAGNERKYHSGANHYNMVNYRVTYNNYDVTTDIANRQYGFNLTEMYFTEGEVLKFGQKTGGVTYKSCIRGLIVEEDVSS